MRRVATAFVVGASLAGSPVGAADSVLPLVHLQPSPGPEITPYVVEPTSPPARGGVARLLTSLKRLSSAGPQRTNATPLTVTAPASPLRGSPHRSPTFPPPDFLNAAASSFDPGSPRLANLAFNGSLSSLTSRSRNSSRLDLTHMTRTVSRTNSSVL